MISSANVSSLPSPFACAIRFFSPGRDPAASVLNRFSDGARNFRRLCRRGTVRSTLCLCLVSSLAGADEAARGDALDGWLAGHARGTDVSGLMLREPEDALTLEAAIRLALETNPSVAAARREIEASEAQVLQGSLRRNPELSLTIEDTRTPSRSRTAQLDVPIETGGKREARIDAAERGRELAVADLGALQKRLRAAVMAAFFDVLAAQELRALAQDSAQLARRATEMAAKRVAAGKISPVEETKARVAEAGVKVALTQAESELRNARRRLTSFWGNATPRFTVATGEVDRLPEMPLPEVIEARLEAAPVVERARRELERRKSLVTVEQSKTVPDLTLSVGMQRREEVAREQVLVGVSVPLPLFNRNQGNLLEALRREDKARAELLSARLALSNDVLQTLERVRARREEADLLRADVLPGARSAYEAATIGFENGKFSFLEVLDAQRTYFSAKSQYLNALAALHRAVTDLESLLGDLGATPNTPNP